LAQINSQSIYEPGTGRFILASLLRRLGACSLSVFDSRGYLLKLDGEAIRALGSLTERKWDGLHPTGRQQEKAD
jgi:hypothetical protein